MLQQARDIFFARKPVSREYATILGNLADYHHERGNLRQARALLEEARGIRTALHSRPHPDDVQTLINLALIDNRLKDHDTAKALLDQAEEIVVKSFVKNSSLHAKVLINRARVLHDAGDPRSALPLYQQVREMRLATYGKDHPLYSSILTNLAGFHIAQGEYGTAEPLITEALAIDVENLRRAATAQSQRQQLVALARFRTNLDCLLSLPESINIRTGDIYDHVLAWKGSVLARQRQLSVVRRLAARSPAGPLSKALQEWAEHSARYARHSLGTPSPGTEAAWRREADELRQLRDESEASLNRLAATAGGVPNGRRSVSDLRKALPQGTVMVDFLKYARFTRPDRWDGNLSQELHVVAFVVRPDNDVVLVRLGPEAAVRDAVDDWLTTLRRDAPVMASLGSSDPAVVLRTLVWDKLEPYLSSGSTILVSPDGPLCRLSFGALPGKDPAQYLIEERTVTIVPVPALIGLAGAGQVNTPSLLCVSDVDYRADTGPAGVANLRERMGRASVSDFHSLPATGLEATSVAKSFAHRFSGAPAPIVLNGASATEGAVRRLAPGRRFLHLATHGYFAPPSLRSALGPARWPLSDPSLQTGRINEPGVAGWNPELLSGLALAGANTVAPPSDRDDGILSALEVEGLDLSGVELAVLSACETALGDEAGGEGLLGLQRAFQAAGAAT